LLAAKSAQGVDQQHPIEVLSLLLRHVGVYQQQEYLMEMSLAEAKNKIYDACLYLLILSECNSVIVF